MCIISWISSKTLKFPYKGNQTIPSGDYMPFSQGHGDAEGRGGYFVSGIQRPHDLESWEEVLRHSSTGTQMFYH